MQYLRHDPSSVLETGTVAGWYAIQAPPSSYVHRRGLLSLAWSTHTCMLLLIILVRRPRRYGRGFD